MSISMLLKRALPGASESVASHIKRGERIARAIQERFTIAEPRQWQAKHLRWVLAEWSSHYSTATQYDYWRTARVLASALDHWPDWEPYLRGAWSTIKDKNGKNNGGRPPKLARPVTRGARS